MHTCTTLLALVAFTQAAPVHRRDEDVVSALTANALNPTAEGVDALGAVNNVVTALTGNALDPTAKGVDALGGQLSTIVGEVAGSDDSDSITAFLADTSIPATQEGVEILTGAVSE